MALRRNSAAAGKSLIQQFKAGNFLNNKLAPLRDSSAAALASDLVRKEAHSAFLNAIILRLCNPKLIVIGEAQQLFLVNGSQNRLVYRWINAAWRRMPDYMDRAFHLFILHKIAGFAQLLT